MALKNEQVMVRISAEQRAFLDREAMEATIAIRRTFSVAKEITISDIIRLALDDYRFKREKERND